MRSESAVGTSMTAVWTKRATPIPMSTNIALRDAERSQTLNSDLLERIRKRVRFDKRNERVNFVFYQLFVGLTIAASFSSAIVAAYGSATRLTVALLASFPGLGILLDRNFQFSHRWRWHNAMGTELTRLEQKLVFEKADVSVVSEEFSKLLIEMEHIYPAEADSYARRLEHGQPATHS
jgi:hypothetical protein